MIVTDVGNHTQQGRDDIGAVEAAAKSHFNNGHIHLFAGKMIESHGHAEFKKGRLDGLDLFKVFLYKINNPALRNVFSIDFDPLPKIFVVGADVQAGF